jgi:hypothetical protein
MSIIVGTPVLPQVENTVEIVQLQVITRTEEWENLFDRIEIWRSRVSPLGPFEALTALSWSPAILPRNAGGIPPLPVTGRQVLLQGTQLLLKVDGVDDLVVTFSTPGAVSYAAAAGTITTQGAGRFSAYVDGDGKVILLGTRPGTGAVLEVTGGDAAPLLGLPLHGPENIAYGRDAHIGLIPGQQQYLFTDLRGSKRYYYRTRFFNAQTLATSEFSTAFSVNQSLGISPANVVFGFVALVGTDGRPLVNQLVQVYAPTQSQLIEGKLVTGPRQARFTDVNGYVAFTLVRGVQYVVSVTGTDLVRNIQAPTDPTITMFSLFEKSIGLQDDLFTVDRPPLVYAEARTL